MIRLSNFSLASLRQALSEAQGEYALLALTNDKVLHVDAQRLEQVARDTDAAMVYANFIRDGIVVPLYEIQPGSFREDFDFGPVVLVNVNALRTFCELPCVDYRYAAFYAFWLQYHRAIFYLPEVLSAVESIPAERQGEAQFDYVDPRNREAQKEFEHAFLQFLDYSDALIEPGKPVCHDGDFPVEASVIIPVRNRVNTISDAIRSAMSQRADFDFNVIVVDNHSTDGTTEAIKHLAEQDSRIVHIVPDPGHGIGGCWNVALDAPQCGRFAVQLDSDDVYSGPESLQRIVEKFRETGAAMVIGSYTLTDFHLNVIPPGLIDHAEWTDQNGANNALRLNGLGAPRAFFTPIARQLRFPDTCYGEDYAMALRVTREYKLARIFDSLYCCRRWGGNSDSNLSKERLNTNNYYKDRLRLIEFCARLGKIGNN